MIHSANSVIGSSTLQEIRANKFGPATNKRPQDVSNKEYQLSSLILREIHKTIKVMLTVASNPEESKTSSLRYWLTNSSKSRDFLLILLIVFGCLYFRRPDAFYNAQLYDEDGTDYLSGFEHYGIKAIILPLNQYIQLVPHLLAVIFGLLSINLLYIPFCYNISCFILTVFIACKLWESANYLGLKFKILYATCFLIVPVGPDMYMNLPNIQWFLSLYIIDYLFIGYKIGGKYLKLIPIFLFSFTGPITLLLSPLILLIMFLDRKKLETPNFIAYLVMLSSGLIDLITQLKSGIRHRSSVQIKPSFALPPEHLHLLKVIINNIKDILFLNSKHFSSFSSALISNICLIAFATIMAFTLLNYKKITNNRKYVLLIAAVLYFVSYVLAFWPQESKLTAFTVARYYLIPYNCIFWIAILAWDKAIQWWWIALYLIFFYKHSGNMKSILYDKHWKQQVEEYYQGTRDTFYINEGGANWGWEFVLPKRKK